MLLNTEEIMSKLLTAKDIKIEKTKQPKIKPPRLIRPPSGRGVINSPTPSMNRKSIIKSRATKAVKASTVNMALLCRSLRRLRRLHDFSPGS